MATTAQHVNVPNLRRAYDAFAAKDMATVSELIANDTVWHIGGDSHLAGDYKGKDAVLGFLGKLMERTGGTFNPGRPGGGRRVLDLVRPFSPRRP
jgi:ketosteroid isomerase-like protein